MLTADKLIPQGRGLARVLLQRAPILELPWAVRCSGRFEATDSAGRALAVTLAAGSIVRGGDVLVADDGSFIVVRAATEALLTVRHCAEHGSPRDLLRAAWEIGRRALPLEAHDDHLRLPADPALARWLRGRHLIVGEVHEAFEPEAEGAAQHDHDHAHHHGHGHDDHGHDHGHGHGHDHHGHDHHGHDHGHDHGHGDGPEHR